MIEDQEAAHRGALNDQAVVIPDPRPVLEVAVARDRTAEHNAPAEREVVEGSIADFTADVVEEDVDPIRAGLPDTSTAQG